MEAISHLLHSVLPMIEAEVEKIDKKVVAARDEEGSTSIATIEHQA
jgi:hypothetical protein